MVYFVGAGTGAADLITVRGRRLLEQADVIIYAGSLVNPELLGYAGEGCEIHNSAEMTLEEVLEAMQKAEAEGKTTVRLHTGEPSIYGAVREQMDALDRLGICYESCPGVSACFGAAASLNLEYTLPGISQSLIITRMEGKTKVPEKERIESLAAHQASMAIYLSAGMLRELSERLEAGGYGKKTPAALVYKATWPEEEAYFCTVDTLYDTAKAHGITKTAVVLVGEAIAHQGYERSRLYAPDFSTEYRKPAGDRSSACGEIRTDRGSMGTGKLGNSGKISCLFTPCLSIISFTKNGALLSEKVAEAVMETSKTGNPPVCLETVLYTKCSAYGTGEHWNTMGEHPILAVNSTLGEWTKEQLEEGNALLFIGACGIAVRAAAPYIRDKLHDSPVLVMDEAGRHVIPLLSGHAGGANALAVWIAEKTGAEAVVTTATDLNRKFAADLFAKRNRLFITNKDGITRVSSKVLAGEYITLSIEPGHLCADCEPPEGVRMIGYPPAGPADIVITSEHRQFEAALLLRPREYVIGIGCRKGKEAEKIAAFIAENLEKAGILLSQVFGLASIDVKKEEPGLLAWSRKEKLPFVTFTAGELSRVEGDFCGSGFVKEQVGVDNVCERAALRLCGAGGRLVCKKNARDGMTMAVARREWRVSFAEE